jgi:hypothetical protein
MGGKPAKPIAATAAGGVTRPEGENGDESDIAHKTMSPTRKKPWAMYREFLLPCK